MDALNDQEIIRFEDVAHWEAWLADHHELRTGVWLKIAKKGSGRASVTHAEALDVALCFGWIDSHRRSLDETYFLQKFSPRRPRSSWSSVNVNRVEALIAAGRMQPSGLAEIDAARADGRWAGAYESQRNATVPQDLAAALERNERARAQFASLGRTDRYLAILRLLKAIDPNDRAARIQKLIAILEAGGGAFRASHDDASESI